MGRAHKQRGQGYCLWHGDILAFQFLTVADFIVFRADEVSAPCLHFFAIVVLKINTNYNEIELLILLVFNTIHFIVEYFFIAKKCKWGVILYFSVIFISLQLLL